VEREQTLHEIIKTGIQLHLVVLSYINNKQYFGSLDVDRSRTAIHNWIQKADLKPSDGASPNRLAVDETAIQIDSDRFCLYAAVDPHTNEFQY
jgi:putative transposase